jgi:hypothetical protein
MVIAMKYDIGTWLTLLPNNAFKTYISVNIAPTSTTNITGFFHWMSGRNITNDCFKAGISVFFSSNALPLTRRGGFIDFEEVFSAIFSVFFSII